MNQSANIRTTAYYFTFTGQGYFFSYWYFMFKKFIRSLIG